MTVGIQTSLYLLTGMAEGASLLSSFGKESACSAGDLGLIPGSGKIPWRRKWQPIPVLPGEFHGYIEEPGGLQSWGRKKSDMTWPLNNNNNNSSLKETNIKQGYVLTG